MGHGRSTDTERTGGLRKGTRLETRGLTNARPSCIFNVYTGRNMTTELGRWGNSLGVRIPKALAERAGLQAGDRVSLDVAEDGTLVVRPAVRRYSLDELVGRISPRNRHDESDWGAPSGREQW